MMTPKTISKFSAVRSRSKFSSLVTSLPLSAIFAVASSSAPPSSMFCKASNIVTLPSAATELLCASSNLAQPASPYKI